MGEYRGKDWQGTATSVRDRMDFLYNNTDMADLHILASDEQWWWGQTVKDFTAHRLVLCSASPVFHQLFYPVEGGPELPSCLAISQSNNSGITKVEVDGVPPIAMEALLEYCYKDRFDKSDYENGYSRNLLWRLWHASKIFKVKHLFQLCSEALEGTMCDETVFWDLNYSLIYQEYGTEKIRKRVTGRIESLENSLYEHPNLIWLDSNAIREILKSRVEGNSEPVIVLNNIIRWSLYQLDQNLCDDVDGKKDADIPLEHRIRLLQQIKEGQVKDYRKEDINKYLDRVLDLVPFEEMSQKDFLQHVIDSGLLDQEKFIAVCKKLMLSVVENPERLQKSVYAIRTNPATTFSPFTKPLSTAAFNFTKPNPETVSPPRVENAGCVNQTSTENVQEFSNNSEEGNLNSPLRARPSIKMSLEQARLRRTQDCRKPGTDTDSSKPNRSSLLLVE